MVAGNKKHTVFQFTPYFRDKMAAAGKARA